MARTIEVVPPGDQPGKRKGRSVPTVRRTRVIVRKVGPWSVLRFSLLFYFCVMVAFWVALIVVYNFLGAIGVLHSIEHGIRGIGGKTRQQWTIHRGSLFSRVFTFWLVLVG